MIKINSVINLSDTEKKKIKQNEIEDGAFNQRLNSFMLNNKKTTESIVIGTTPYALTISGAPNANITISPEVLSKCMRKPSEKGQGHTLPLEYIRKIPKKLREPIMIFKGSHPNSLVAITDLKDKDKNVIMIAVALSKKEGFHTVNRISSMYGKSNIFNYLAAQIGQSNLISANKKEAEQMLHSARLQLPLENTFISFDNSIAYTTANVKYPNEKNLNKGDELSMTEQEMLAQIEALRKEFEGKLAKMEEKFDTLSSKVETIDKFVAAMTEAQGFEQTMSEVESVTKQLTGCNEAVFYCYDNAADKFFSGSEEHRNWTDPRSAEEIKSVFDSGIISENGSKAVIPLISSKGETVGVIAAEKENGFTAADLDYFKQGSQIIGTVELALNKEFEHQGRVTDELTNLKNRQGLNEYVSDTVRQNINEDKPVNIVMCDIDHFKNINDTYGHDAGDIVLKNVAQILQEGTRSGADCAFRMGGEEMVLILNCEPEQAYEIAERLRTEVENAVHKVSLDGKETEISVTVSMGVHQMKPEKEMTAENSRAVFDSEFKFADDLVYEAKESGRNRVISDNSETVIELADYISADGNVNEISEESKTDKEEYIPDNSEDFVDLNETAEIGIPEKSEDNSEKLNESIPEKSEDISRFLAETGSIKGWINEAQGLIEERTNELDEQSKDNER